MRLTASRSLEESKTQRHKVGVWGPGRGKVWGGELDEDGADLGSETISETWGRLHNNGNAQCCWSCALKNG